jgi:hypothetical protein
VSGERFDNLSRLIARRWPKKPMTRSPLAVSYRQNPPQIISSTQKAQALHITPVSPTVPPELISCITNTINDTQSVFSECMSQCLKITDNSALSITCGACFEAFSDIYASGLQSCHETYCGGASLYWSEQSGNCCPLGTRYLQPEATCVANCGNLFCQDPFAQTQYCECECSPTLVGDCPPGTTLNVQTCACA